MTTPGISSASEIQMDYTKLLIAQMQNQNPLEPMDNNEMALQLAQLSQLSQLESVKTNLESMNSSFAEVLASTDRAYANSLLGKQVTFLTEGDDGVLQMEGIVNEVFNDSETGQSLLGVKVDDDNSYTLGLGGVIVVRN